MLQQHYTIFKTIGLPTKVPSVADPEKIWDQICYDKHFVGGTMHTAILQSIGVVSRTAEGGFTHAFDKDIVLQAIHINQSRKD
jgi:3-dehydroquinate synthetase